MYCDFEDDQAYYLATVYVEGVDMSSLSEEQRTVVYEELSVHLAKLKTLRSNRMGGPSGIVIPPIVSCGRPRRTTGACESLTTTSLSLPQRPVAAERHCRPRHTQDQRHH